MICTVEANGHVRDGRAEPIDDDWGKSRLLSSWKPPASPLTRSQDWMALAMPKSSSFSTRCARHRREWRPLSARTAGLATDGHFAQLGKNRPNRMGVTVRKILSVVGTRLNVEGLDAIDGTPIIDIKPVMREFLAREDIREPVWGSELMAAYW